MASQAIITSNVVPGAIMTTNYSVATATVATTVQTGVKGDKGDKGDTGATGPAGASGGVTDHTLLTNIGTNTHAQIDTALTRLANTAGTNTGDETTSTIKTKLGVTTLSGSNTGDQDLSGYATTSSVTTGLAAKQNTLSLTTTGSSGAATLTGATLNIPQYGATVPDATATVKGIVQLTNDLGGTAANPTVPGLASKSDTTHNHSLDSLSNVVTGAKANTDLLQWSTGTNRWTPTSYPTAASLGAQSTLVSGTNIKTINGTSVLGSGDITVSGGGAGWTLIANGTDFTSTTKNITGLAGNTDLLYKLVIHASFSSDSILQLGFNNDSSVSNFAYGFIVGGMDGGAALNPTRNFIAKGSLACINLNYFGGKGIVAEILIGAVSGAERTVSFDVSESNGGNNRALAIRGTGFWTDTTSNLTTINMIANNAPVSGNYWLYKAG